MRRTTLLLTALVAAAFSLPAQAPTRPPCPYERCALNVVPRWNGLAVVRGSGEEPVALLGFFRAGRLDAAFADDATAAALAARAVRVRRVAATFTDLGLVLLTVGAAGAIADGSLEKQHALIAGAGAVSLGVSVPLQFSADGHLSRAVWQFNRRFAAEVP